MHSRSIPLEILFPFIGTLNADTKLQSEFITLTLTIFKWCGQLFDARENEINVDGVKINEMQILK